MEGFRGFPDGRLKAIPLPEPFFSELLPMIDHLCELKVTLHCFWLLYRKEGDVRYVTSAELETDEILMRGLRDPLGPRTTNGRQALQEGLERAVARGTLLQATARHPGGPAETWYFLNSESGREAVSRVERGEWVPAGNAEPVRLETRRPNIFNLYEQNFGSISPLLAEELVEAEETYPAKWIEEAFRIAVANNARRWSYVRAVLERWSHEGRGSHSDQDPAQRRRDIDGKYGDLIRH